MYKTLLGFTLQPEKEIVAILVPREQKLPVMQAINREAGLKTRLPRRAVFRPSGRHYGPSGIDLTVHRYLPLN